MPTSSRFRPRAFQLLNKKRERERDRGRKRSKVWLCQLERTTVVIPLSRGRILGNPLSFQSTIPKLSSDAPPLPPPHHVRVNNTPILCAPRKARFLSKWIHDEFLFRGLNARGSHFSSIFPFARALSPLTTAIPVHRRPPFLIFSSVGRTRSHVEYHDVSKYEQGLNFLNAVERQSKSSL